MDSLLLNMLELSQRLSVVLSPKEGKKKSAAINKGEIQQKCSMRCKIHIAKFILMSVMGKHVVYILLALAQTFSFTHSGYPSSLASSSADTVREFPTGLIVVLHWFLAFCLINCIFNLFWMIIFFMAGQHDYLHSETTLGRNSCPCPKFWFF